MPEPTKCEICGKRCTHVNSDGAFCDDCYNLLYFECDECHQWHRILARMNHNGRHLCRSCYERRVGTCDRCGNHVDRDQMRDYHGQHLCRECFRNIRNEGICDYHSHRYPDFYDHELRLGFELETGGASHDNCMNTVTAMNDLWEAEGRKFNMEHDGSIPCYGFELISLPYKMQEYNDDHAYWDKVLMNLRDGGLKSCSECGLHIHASRAFMEMSRWILVGWLIVSNKSKFEALCRRKSCHYASYNASECFSDYDYDSRNDRNHYDAINFGSSKPTVEFRMFASTTNCNTLYEDLELITALAHFVKNANTAAQHEIIENPEEAFNKFKAYVAENHYNLALNLIKRKGV